MNGLIERLRHIAPHGNLVADSRQVSPGDIFLAWPGDVHDGRMHIPAAIAAGAAAVVWESAGYAWPAALSTPNLPCPGLQALSAELAVTWYGDPSARLWSIGITGTNGKTSCSHWLARSLSALGRKTAVIGTLGNGFPDALQTGTHTTPDAVSLQGLLAGFVTQGTQAVAMEVSSHALDQGRVAGMHFDVAVLTNLSRDHLDYHGDMAAYAHAKTRLFDWPGLRAAVLNAGDPLGARLSRDLASRAIRVLTYGIGQGDVRAENLCLNAGGIRFDLLTPQGSARIESSLLGRFNAENLLACAGTLLVSDVPLADIARQLSGIEAVVGRLEALPGKPDDPRVVIDYAHTPDALEKVLATLKPLARGRLICVFGCGGGRDRGKRALMGAAVANGADTAIITSDNPRHEDPQAIIDALAAAMPAGTRRNVDRAAAIRIAIAEAGPDDIVLIAGKGHETYQEIAGARLPFSDHAVAGEALATRHGGDVKKVAA